MASCQDSQPKRAFLTVIRGRADLGVHAFIEDRAVVGRDPNCEFPLLDHRVSRRHATIMPVGVDRYLIQDLGSTNGTRVGGSLIAGPHLLQDGEKILVGETVIRFSLADEIDIDFQSEIAMLVGTDPLTGLPSKRRFDEALEFALQAAKQASGSLAVLMMDMDGVKRINDTHGHLFGAHVIGETGRLIARVLGSRGRACRFGGDEFSGIPARPRFYFGVCDCPTDSSRRRNRSDGEGWNLSGTHDQHRCGLLSRIRSRTSRPHLEVRRSTLSRQSARQELRFHLKSPTRRRGRSMVG